MGSAKVCVIGGLGACPQGKFESESDTICVNICL